MGIIRYYGVCEPGKQAVAAAVWGQWAVTKLLSNLVEQLEMTSVTYFP